MASTRTHEVKATVGEYTDQSGAKKKRYITVGAAFTDDQGRVSIKLESVPVSPEWSGWLSLYPVERNGNGQQRQSPPRTPKPAPLDDDEDDIPF
ncbi:hypothetical protein TSACC_21680 [Terrimicrobium sacchariphilum]|uniref:Uncharacterized protein n=1 Tax=Terrimicrobium sacchariphilum TaxID=690879 RepID=A0A146G8T2_TERSA|nr:hypothetical protein [Terrimicrobium sacchariphilum]GAT33267.1 hypothetical protein TSACC_21680 [Terrimicrobium sacchariphilum]